MFVISEFHYKKSTKVLFFYGLAKKSKTLLRRFNPTTAFSAHNYAKQTIFRVEMRHNSDFLCKFAAELQTIDNYDGNTEDYNSL